MEQAVQVLSHADGQSELDIARHLKQITANHAKTFDSGWYSPPPNGIGVLLGCLDNLTRLDFDSLRKLENWPKNDYFFERETVGLIYMSPIDRTSGMIGDFGLTLYRGKNQAVRRQLKLAYKITSLMAEHATVGMKLRDLFEFGQKTLTDNGAISGRMFLINDPSDINFGHTVPWSYEMPTGEEQQTIDSGDFNQIKELISSKRVYINRDENFRIPKTCAFTIEPRVVTIDESGQPRLAYFHIMVAFKNGQKIVSGFDSIFAKLDMNYILAPLSQSSPRKRKSFLFSRTRRVIMDEKEVR
jgi:hypothetical protein